MMPVLVFIFHVEFFSLQIPATVCKMCMFSKEGTGPVADAKDKSQNQLSKSPVFMWPLQCK